MCTHKYGGQWDILGISPYLLPSVRWALIDCCILETNWPMSLWNSPVSTFPLTASAGITDICYLPLGLCMGRRDSNSVPHMCPLIYIPSLSIDFGLSWRSY